MTKEEIIKGNALIYRFTDSHEKEEYCKDDPWVESDLFWLEGVKYHSSWDSLIPAIKKFRELLAGKYKEQNEQLFHLWDLVMRTYKAFDMEYTFKNFVYLLEWYEKQPKYYTECHSTERQIFSAMQGGTDGG